MTYVLTFLAGCFLGGMVGVFTMRGMMTAKEADEREERWHDERS